MKRVIILAVILVTTLLIGCTDETKEQIEQLEFEKELNLIEKDEVEEPEDR